MKYLILFSTFVFLFVQNFARAETSILCGASAAQSHRGLSVVVTGDGPDYDYRFTNNVIKDREFQSQLLSNKKVRIQTGKPTADSSCELRFSNKKDHKYIFSVRFYDRSSGWRFLMPPGEKQLDLPCEVSPDIRNKLCSLGQSNSYPTDHKIIPLCDDANRSSPGCGGTSAE
ncbi:MAG: hypothetical protein AABZ55_00855 [Bdellovibrionota bacterium]|mgnify:CR=1 FL=1